MSIYFSTSRENVPWEEVAEILQNAGLSDLDARMQEKVFRNSYAVVIVYDDRKVIGCGRAISDGVCQGAIYNIAFREAYRHMGLGTELIKTLLDLLKGQSVILYTNPPGVSYYEKFGFKRAKTSMCIYEGSEEKIKMMQEHGFLLPEGYRFEDEGVAPFERIPDRDW